MIKELTKEGIPETEIEDIVMEFYGVDRLEAQSIIDIERGDSEGDLESSET